MATYYCDPSQDFADQTGADHVGNQLYGPGGIQAAIRGTGNAIQLVAGDELHVKAETFWLDRLVWFDIDQDVSGWGIGDAVRNDNDAGGAPGDDWTGVVCETSYGTNVDQVLVQLDSPYVYGDVNNADGIENTDALGGAADPTDVDIDDSACRGIEIFTGEANEGDTVSGNIKLIGVNSAWATGRGSAYQAVLDGNSVATYCVRFDARQRWLFTNLTLKNATNYCLTSIANSLHNLFTYCIVESGGSHGINGLACRWSKVIQCIIRNHTSTGIQNMYGIGVAFSVVNTNGLDGASVSWISDFYGTLFYGNSVDNLSCGSRSEIVNCIFDGSRNGSGVKTSAVGVPTTIWGCRFTNNNQFGIEGPGAGEERNTEDWNVFYNNAQGARTGFPTGPNSDDSPATSGYVDVKYVFDFDNGIGVPFVVGETITTVGGKTGVLTAVTDGGATGALTFNQEGGGIFIDGEAITGGLGGKTADVDGTISVAADPDYTLIASAEISATGVEAEIDLFAAEA